MSLIVLLFLSGPVHASSLISAQSMAVLSGEGQGAAFDGGAGREAAAAVSELPAAPRVLPAVTDKVEKRRTAVPPPASSSDPKPRHPWKFLGLLVLGMALLAVGTVILAGAPAVGLAIAAAGIQAGGVFALAGAFNDIPDED